MREIRQAALEELARALAYSKPAHPPHHAEYHDIVKAERDYRLALRQWTLDVKAVARAAALTNRRFDYKKFYGMCGMPHEETQNA